MRFGAVGFGAGSLVFTGLQIGAEIASGPFRAITPAARLLLITAQMHFIFLNSKNLEFARLGALAKLGLMHMIATNLCEWLQVSGKIPIYYFIFFFLLQYFSIDENLLSSFREDLPISGDSRSNYLQFVVSTLNLR